MDKKDIAEQAYNNGYGQGVAAVIAYIEEKDKSIGKFSIYNKLVKELKETFFGGKGNG
jgi:hypothetical protein